MSEEDVEYKPIDGATVYVSSTEVALTLLLASIGELDQVINKHQRGEVAGLANEALSSYTGKSTWAILYSAKVTELWVLLIVVLACFLCGADVRTTMIICVAANVLYTAFAWLVFRGFSILAIRGHEALIKRLAELNKGYAGQLDALRSREG